MAELVPRNNAPTATVAFRPPPAIPDHTLLRCIGMGGYGEVWLAQNILGTYRAVKIVYRSSFDEDRPYEREFNGIKRFEPISRSHEGLVDILQTGRNDEAGYFYYVMELADPSTPGETEPENYSPRTIARERAARNRFPVQDVTRTAMTLAAALSHLHASGLVHRDIKPSNIIFVSEVPKLADIGLVTAATEARSYVGTEGFIPPEGPGSPQADIFALGKVIYEIAMGRDRADFPELAPDVDPIRDARLFELNEIILKACERDPAKRYQSAEELWGDLHLLSQGESVKRLRVLERRWAAVRKWSVTGSLVASLLVAGSYHVATTYRHRKEALHEKAAAYVARGIRFLEEGHLFAALAWFGEALRLEAHDPVRSHTHRVRIAAVARHCPGVVASRSCEHAVSFGSFSSDGNLVATAHANGSVHIYDSTLSKALLSVQHGSEARNVAFSLAGDLVVTVGADTAARIWSTATGEEALAPLDHEAQVYSAVFSPDGHSVLTACEDGAVYLWQLTPRTRVRVAGHRRIVESARFSPDGQKIVTASRDRSAQLWDLSGRPGPRLLHDYWVYYATFSPDGLRVVTASYDKTIGVWDAVTGQQIFKLPHNAAVASAEFSPDGQYIVTACWDNTARLWDAFTGDRVFAPLAHFGQVMYACFAPEGKRVLTVSTDRTARIWDLDDSAAAPRPLSGVSHATSQQRFSLSNGAVRVASEAFAGWQALRVPFAVDEIAFNSTAAMAALLSEGDAPQVQVWDLQRKSAVSRALKFASRPTRFALDAQGSTLLWCDSQSVQLWDVARGAAVKTLLQQPSRVTVAVFDSVGRYLATASDTNLYLWHTATGERLGSPLGHESAVTHAAFSSDSRFLVTTCSDRKLEPRYGQLWKISTSGATPMLRLPHGDGVAFATFSPDNAHVATASEDCSARIWTIGEDNGSAVPLLHKDQVKHCQFSPDGRWIATASRDRSARIWNVATGHPITPTLLHAEPVIEVTWLTNGDGIITRTDSGNCFLWTLSADSRSVDDIAQSAHALAGMQIVPGRTVKSFARNDIIPTMTNATVQAKATLADWHGNQAKQAELHERSFAATFHLTRLLKDAPNDDALLLRRGSAFAQSRRWAEAIADFEAALHEGADPFSVRWQLVRVRLACQQSSEVLDDCKDLLTCRTTLEEPSVANLIAWTCALVPDAADPRIVTLAEAAVAADPKNAMYGKTLGAAYYRVRSFAKAVVTLEPLQKSRLEALIFLAMSHHQLGHVDDARKLLAEAELWFPDFHRDPYNPWYRLIELEVLMTEARRLIEPERYVAKERGSEAR